MIRLQRVADRLLVSNLLSSPASGEFKLDSSDQLFALGFQFIEFPSEWGVLYPHTPPTLNFEKFPIY